MMMIPRKKGYFDLWDEMFGNDPFFTKDKSNKIMKTDIKEKSDKYLIDVDLPGYSKENIKIEIENGYLTIHATTDENKDEEEENYVRKERYFGECSRSFYIGDNITEEEIKASFKNGTLTLEIPKKDATKEMPNKKYIPIDG